MSAFIEDVQAGRIEDFSNRLRSFFAATPYDLIRDVENYYQNILY